jgi:sterol desaturase/sphingolipid hydroxylase (fatty acid hydroxylase superfamily)
MLTDKEKAFLEYWPTARQRQKKVLYQLGVGLPVGLIFGVLIIANFYSGWYQRADMISNSRFNPAVLYVAVVIIAVFIAVFSKKFQYDQQEQRYLELLEKKKRSELTDTDAAKAPPEAS